MSRLRLGDSSSFGELYVLYWHRVHRFALKLIRNSDLADDIAQETFLKAQKGIGTLKESLSLTSWLFSIARNEVYTHLRKIRRNGQIADDEEVWAEETPHETVVGQEAVEIVREMIARLRPEYQEALLLREFEQLSYAEIAVVTGGSESSVKSRLYKARKALLKKLKPYFGEKE